MISEICVASMQRRKIWSTLTCYAALPGRNSLNEMLTSYPRRRHSNDTLLPVETCRSTHAHSSHWYVKNDIVIKYHNLIRDTASVSAQREKTNVGIWKMWLSITSLTERDANKLLKIFGASTALWSELYSCWSVLTFVIKVKKSMTSGRIWLAHRTRFAVWC